MYKLMLAAGHSNKSDASLSKDQLRKKTFLIIQSTDTFQPTFSIVHNTFTHIYTRMHTGGGFGRRALIKGRRFRC